MNHYQETHNLKQEIRRLRLTIQQLATEIARLCNVPAYYVSLKLAPQRTEGLKLLYEDELKRALETDGSSSSSFITPKTYYPNV